MVTDTTLGGTKLMQNRTFILIFAMQLFIAFASEAHAQDNFPNLITDGELQPYHSDICHLDVDRRFGSGALSTGVLIEGRFLITAAHNIHDYNFIRRVNGIKVRCGEAIVGKDEPALELTRSEITASRFVAPNYRWRRNKSKEFSYDYAFLDLGVDLTETSFFDVTHFDQVDASQGLFVAGYPGKNLCGDPEICDARHLYEGHGDYEPSSLPDRIEYAVKTARGMSGGPVWAVNDGQNFLVGVHVTGKGARVINDSFLGHWRNWRDSRAN